MQTPNKTTLYVGDNNWSGWAGSSDWMIQNTPAGTVGVLLNDGSQNMKWIAPTILAPYQVSGTADYAVDAHIDVMFNQGGIWDGCFGIGLRGSNTSDNGWQGYWATICHTGSSTDSATVYIQASSPNLHSTNLTQISFAPQYGWNYTYTYRVEVIGSSIRLFVDGSFLAQVTDTNFPTGGQIGFASYNTPLSIYDFSVEAI